MSLSKLPDIPRVFAEWGTDQVLQWLSTLQLSRDYSKQFRDHNIDGPALLRLNPSSLSSLGISDRLDRVKLLQQITTMQADLASLAIPARRWKGSGKFRRFSENNPIYRTLATPTRRISMDNSTSRQTLGISRGRHRPSILDAYPTEWNKAGAQSVHSLSGTSSSNSGTLYSVTDGSSSVIGASYSDVTVPRSEAHLLTKMAHSDLGPSRSRSAEGRRGDAVRTQLRRKTSHPKDKEKRLSSSMDKLWEAQLAANPLPLVTNDASRYVHGMPHYHSAGAQFQENLVPQDSIAVRLYDSPSHPASTSVQLHDSTSYHDNREVQMHENARLVEILREENAALKKELEIYYKRVCKLMRLEQEMERVRESHRLLEESSRRRDRLQAAMRTKLEAELARLKHNSEQSQKQYTETSSMPDGNSEKVLERRESVVKRRLQMVDQSTMVDMLDQSTFHDTQNRTETDGPELYSQRIDQLRDHLQSLQQISLRREGLERQVRNQLQAEIQELRGKEGKREDPTETGEGENVEGKGESKMERKEGDGTQMQKSGRSSWEREVAVLQADLAKWEQKCTELAAEKELAVEVAVVHKESHINQLKQALVVREGEVTDLTQQSQSCQSQLAEAQKHITQLQTSLSLLKSPDTSVLQNKSPGHQAQTAPSLQLHSSPPHQVQLLPHHQVHSSPPHQLHSSPPHQIHSPPSHSTYSSPAHQVHTSPTHRLHHSPPHQLHSSPTRSRQTSPINKPQTTSELSRCSTSPSSSLIVDPQSHSNQQVHRDQPPHLTNGGEDPVISTSLYTSAGPLVAPKHILVDPRQGSSSLPSSFTDDHSLTITRSDAASESVQLSGSNRVQVVKRVKSKTPPPRSEVRILPKNKHSSLDRGSPTSHTPSDLQLFNTLLGEGVPGERGHHDSGNRISTLSSKGVNSLLSHPQCNRV